MDKWAHLGHQLGECWVNTDKSITYINIPKNASSYMKACLMGSGDLWTYHDHFVPQQRTLVILRDPVERWCSGIAQSLFNSGTELPDDIVFKRITVDDHTELQTYFLQDIDLDNCDFIMVNDNFRSNLQFWFDQYGYNTDITHLQQLNSSQNDGRRYLKQKYKMIIDNDPEFVLKLQQHFEEDYKLISKVKFYGN
jgi:hypothetical protein